MKKSELNLMVIENFIDYFTTNDEERDQMKQAAQDYIKEDWVYGEENPENNKTEVQRAKDTLKANGYYTDVLWCEQDVTENYECTSKEAQEVLDNAFGNQATYDQIWLSISYAAEYFKLKRKNDE